MKEGMNKLKCGACGCDIVTLYINQEQDFVAECKQCKSTTEINIHTRIQFDFGERSDGILAVF